MKKILSFLLLVIFISCGKDGSMGPQGEQGIQGIRGEKGEDGSTIYSGAVVPPTNLGNEGDFYFRTGTSDFYGPKTDTDWGTPTNLKGATGTAGSKILSGTAVPATSTGANDDFYFRTTTADFYGLKTSSGWGTPINLKGVKGEDGSRIYSGTTVPATNLGNNGDFYFRTTTSDFYGPKSASGWGTPTNLKGTTGAAGSKILSGTAIPPTSTGANGDFYLRTTTADFYGPKTSSGWGTPINLRGPQGSVGPQGPPGTANVIYSDWINPTDATWNVFNTERRKQMRITEPRITNDIIQRGVVIVYYQRNNGTTVQFPHEVRNLSGVAQIGYRHFLHNNDLYIEVMGWTRDIADTEYLYHVGGSTHARFRYVIIPGGVSTTAMSGHRNTERSVEIKGKIYTKSYLENMSYTEVSKLVGIPD